MMYGFNVRNWKSKLIGFPQEDALAYDEKRNIACVADGVTRDFSDGTMAGRNPESLFKFLNKDYPNPSPSKEAADICVSSFLRTLSLAKANSEIFDYARTNAFMPPGFFRRDVEHTDYLGKDLAGCTAAGFWLEGSMVNWSYVADSGIAVFDSHKNIRFRTFNEGPDSEGKHFYLESVVKELGGWKNPNARKKIRSSFRNNPANFTSYGTLTGEEEAEKYIERGIAEVSSGDYVLAFTDGIRSIIFPKDESRGIERINYEFATRLVEGTREDVKNLCQKKVKTEGSLIVLRVE